MANQIQLSDLREACLARFAYFACLMQDEGWFDPIHAILCDSIQEEIEKPSRGDGISKMLVVMPRGSLKSTIITKLLPIWLTIRDKNIRCLICANTNPNASKKIEDIRGLYEKNELFRALFPELQPDRDDRWTNVAASVSRTAAYPEATYESAGLKTKIISRHYNLIIEDDTMAPDDSDMHMEGGELLIIPSLEDINRAIGWHKLAYPLLVPKGQRVRIVVTTRWAEEDLADHVQKKEHYKVFDVPAEKDGKITFTNFYSREQLDQLHEDFGTYIYSLLYLNKPVMAKDKKFKEEWFHTVQAQEVPVDGTAVISIDPAIGQDAGNCDTAIIRCVHKRPLIYVTHVIRGRFTPAETISHTLNLVELDYENTSHIMCEANGYQMALVYGLNDAMKERRIFKSVQEVFAKQAKTSRIEAMQPLFQSGRVIFVEGIDSQLRSQLVQYPYGKLVDVIDALAQQLLNYRGTFKKKEEEVKKSPAEIMSAYRGQSADEILKELPGYIKGSRIQLINNSSVVPVGVTNLAFGRN